MSSNQGRYGDGYMHLDGTFPAESLAKRIKNMPGTRYIVPTLCGDIVFHRFLDARGDACLIWRGVVVIPMPEEDR